MTQLISIVAAIAFLVGANFYAQYVFRRFGIVRGPPLQSAMPWPHGRRLALFWFVMAFTGVVVVPAGLVALGYALGMTDCSAQFLPGDPWRCSPVARLSFLVGTVALGLPLAAIWIRFLLGMLARHSDRHHADHSATGH